MNQIVVSLLSLILAFAVLAKGAHDLWSATLVYLLILALFLFLVIKSSWNENSPGFKVAFPLPLAFLIAAFTVSFFYSINPSEAFLSYMDWIFSIILFLVVLNVEWTPSTLKTLSWTVAAVLWAQFFTMLFQWRGNGAGAPLMENPGTLLNANFVAAFCLFWAPVFFGERPVKLISILGGLAVLLNLILLESVWAYACFVLAVGACFWPTILKPFFDKRPRLLPIIVGALLAVIAALLWSKLRMVYEWPTRNPASRFSWWTSALSMWHDHPFRGIGMGNFPSSYLAYKVGVGENTLYAHSFPLGLLAESGLFGASAFLFFLLTWFRFVVSPHPKRSLPWLYAAGVVSFLVFSLFSLSYELLVNLMTLWIFLGITTRQAAVQYWKFRRSLLLILVTGVLASIPFLISPFLASRATVSGEEHLKKGELEEAEKSFLSAAQLDPKAYEPYRGLAQTLAAKGQLEEAAHEQDLALERNRLNGSLWWELGEILEKQADFDGALEAYKRAVLLHPTNAFFEQEVARLEGKS